MNKLLTLFFLFIITSCGPRYSDFLPCTDEGLRKPHVVLLPIYDCTGNQEFADELLCGIRNQLLYNGDLYLYDDEMVNRRLELAGLLDQDFFSADLSYAKKFGGADLVVSVDLLECRSDAYGDVTDKCLPKHLRCKDQFRMKVRLRVVDISCKEPVIIAQEVFCKTLLHPACRTESDQVYRSYFDRLACSLAGECALKLENAAWNRR